MVSIASPKDVVTAPVIKSRRTARKSANPNLRRTTIPVETESKNGNNENGDAHALKKVTEKDPNTSESKGDPSNAISSSSAQSKCLSSETNNNKDSNNVLLCETVTATSTSVRTVVTADSKTIKLVLHSPKPETMVTSASSIKCSASETNSASTPKIPPIIIKTVDDLSLKVVAKEKMDREGLLSVL